jgi:hypothetical protein
MSASMSVSSNRMRTDLNPAGEEERKGGDMLSVLMILLAAALAQRGAPYYTHGAITPTGA